MQDRPTSRRALHPVERLDADDLDMIASFVLESGSIKALAQHYGVSYPTMRIRLDELIERLEAAIDGTPTEPLTEYLAELIEQGRIAPDVAQRIRSLHRRGSNEGSDPVERITSLPRTPR